MWRRCGDDANATGIQRSRLLDTPLTISRLETAIQQKFGTLIDMSDVPSDPTNEFRRKFLTRALAAFAVSYLTGCEPSEAAAGVTDGSAPGAANSRSCER